MVVRHMSDEKHVRRRNTKILRACACAKHNHIVQFVVHGPDLGNFTALTCWRLSSIGVNTGYHTFENGPLLKCLYIWCGRSGVDVLVVAVLVCGRYDWQSRNYDSLYYRVYI